MAPGQAVRGAHLTLDLGGARHRPRAYGCPARPPPWPGPVPPLAVGGRVANRGCGSWALHGDTRGPATRTARRLGITLELLCAGCNRTAVHRFDRLHLLGTAAAAALGVPSSAAPS